MATSKTNCPNCGRANIESAHFCVECSVPLQTEPPPAIPLRTRAPGSVVGGTVTLLVLLLAASGGAWWLLRANGPTGKAGSLDSPSTGGVAAQGETTVLTGSELAVGHAVVVNEAAPEEPAEVRLVPEAASGLSRSAIRQVVTKHLPEVRACYDATLSANPSLAGTVKVRFVIGRDGRVVESSAGSSDLSDSSVVECIVKRFGEMSFPAHEGDDISVEYPVRLNPG